MFDEKDYRRLQLKNKYLQDNVDNLTDKVKALQWYIGVVLTTLLFMLLYKP